MKLYPQLQSFDFTTDLTKCNQIKPDVLIGSDLYWSLLTGEMIKSNDALESHLGWILSGPIVVREGMRPRATLVTHVLRVDAVIENRRLDRVLHLFWDLESLGTEESEGVVQAQFEDFVHFENGRYVVSLPWKESALMLK